MLTRQMDTFGGRLKTSTCDGWSVKPKASLALTSTRVKSAFIRARQRGQTSMEVVDMEAAVSDVVGSRKVATEGRRNASSHGSPLAIVRMMQARWPNRPVPGHLMRKPL